MELRRMLARLGVLVLVCSGLVLGTSATAHACSCASVPLSDSIAEADGIFVGTTGDLVDDLRVTRYVDVDRVYKGDVEARVTVNTGQEGSDGEGNSCNYDLPADRKVVVFASGSGAEWSTGLCSQRYEPMKELLPQLDKRIGPPTEPVPNAQENFSVDGAQQDSSWEVWAGAGAGVLAGLIALLLWRSRPAS